MKKLLLLSVLSLGLNFVNAQGNCFDVHGINGLQSFQDTVGLGGQVIFPTVIEVVSQDIFAITAPDRVGFYMIPDTYPRYGLTLGNAYTGQGFNVYNNNMNIKSTQELNLITDFGVFKNGNGDKYFTIENDQLVFDRIKLFFPYLMPYLNDSVAQLSGIQLNQAYIDGNGYVKIRK
jgi:hypothetical protein